MTNVAAGWQFCDFAPVTAIKARLQFLSAPYLRAISALSHMHKDTNRSRFTPRITLSLVALVGVGVLAWLILRGSFASPAPVAVAEPPPDAQTETRAAAGDIEAQLVLGRWHLGGAGRGRDYPQAAQWLSQAAASGNAEAQYLMGTLCEVGGGVPRSPSNAVMWFERAAAQHHAGALYNLGSMFAAGRGVEQDSARAARFYLEAAELGDALAQFNVAQRFELGRGVGTNLVESWKWFALAAKGGVADAQRSLLALEPGLSKEQLREARQALNSFQSRPLPSKKPTQ